MKERGKRKPWAAALVLVGVCLLVIYPLSKKKVAENAAVLKAKRGE